MDVFCTVLSTFLYISTFFTIKCWGEKFISQICYRSDKDWLGFRFISSYSRTQDDGSSWKWLVAMAKWKRALLGIAQTVGYFSLEMTYATSAHSSLARVVLTEPYPRLWSIVLLYAYTGEGWKCLVGRQIIILTEINSLKEWHTLVPSSLIILTWKGTFT